MFRFHRLFVTLAMSLLMVFGLTTTMMAHNGGSHMSGTIASVDVKANSLTLQDGKQSTVIALTKTTKYVKDKKTAAITDLKAGLRVVVHVQQDEKTKKYTAEEVEIGVADAAAKPPASASSGAPKK